MAKALGRDLAISTKHSAMICNAIKGKSVERARTILTEAINLKKAIPFTRFNSDRGHKSKIGPGRFPVKTCSGILKVLNSAEANGHQKNLSNMHVVHACAHLASKPMHFGRWRRREMKRSHIEIVLSAKEEKTKQEKKPEKAEGKKELPEKEKETEKEKKANKQDD